MDEKYLKRLIKGKITEVVFEEMFRETGKFTVLPIGYEHTMPELAQYQHYVHVKKVLDNIRHTPDFVLISQNKEKVYLVEVKYREIIQTDRIMTIADELITHCDPVFLFVATSEGFFFDPCHKIINNKGLISPLQDSWVSQEMQKNYMLLMKDFFIFRSA